MKEQNIQNYEKENIIPQIKQHNQNKSQPQIYYQILQRVDKIRLHKQVDRINLIQVDKNSQYLQIFNKNLRLIMVIESHSYKKKIMNSKQNKLK